MSYRELRGRVVFLRSNPVDPDPRVEKEARALYQAGWQVLILAWDRTGASPPREERDYATLVRLLIPARFTSFVRKLRHEIQWQIALCVWLVRDRRKYTHIHACDLDTVFPALIAKRLLGKPVIYDMFDFYADMVRGVPRPVPWLLRRAEFWAVNRADAVILADDCRREQIAGSRPRLLKVIYNSPERVNVPLRPGVPGRGLPLRVVLNQCEGGSLAPPVWFSRLYSRAAQMRIAYVGLLHVDRGMLEMLQVLETHPQWKLELGGSGTDEDVIRAAAEKLPNVTFHSVMSYEKALQLYAGADVLFATYDPAIRNHKYSSANKLYEAMMLGKPIIVARDTGMDQVVRKHELGKVVKYGDVAGLEKALTEIAAWDDEDRALLKRRAAKVYEEEFDWSKMSARLVELYEHDLEPGRGVR